MSLRQPTSTLSARLTCFKVPSYMIRLIAEQVSFWSEKSGHEWTCMRLKEFRVDWVRKSAGLAPVGSYSKHSDGTPVGPFRYFFRSDAFIGRNRKHSLRALSIYKTFVSHKPTKAQLKKFYSSVQRPPLMSDLPTPTGRWMARWKDLLNAPIRNTMEAVSSGYYRSVRPGRKQDFETWITSPKRRSPGIEMLFDDGPDNPTWTSIRRPVKAVERDMPLEHHLNALFFPELQGMMQRLFSYFPVEYRSYLQANYPRFKRKHDLIPDMVVEDDIGKYSPKCVPFHVGTISYIQEPGYKLRAVANPFRVWQWLLSGLGDQLFGLLTRCPKDFTFRQHKGLEKVQQFVDGEDEVFSVDLSDATNNFPLQYSIAMMKEHAQDWGLDPFLVNLFGAISQQPWLSPEGNLVKWTVGQPLGLYPSFACFALSHHYLLTSLLKDGDDYVILGDDVVIRGRQTYEAYRHALSQAGIPVSLPKTLESNHVAEFAGRLITRGSSVIRGHNYSSLTDDSFFDLIEELGPGYVKFVPAKYRKVVKALASLPQPLGFGWNPQGVPLVDRLQGKTLERYLRGTPITGGNRNGVDSPLLERLCSFGMKTAKELMLPKALMSIDDRWNVSDASYRRGGGSSNRFHAPPIPLEAKETLSVLAHLKSVGLPILDNLSDMEYRLRACYRDESGSLVLLPGDALLIRNMFFNILKEGVPTVQSSSDSRFRQLRVLSKELGMD